MLCERSQLVQLLSRNMSVVQTSRKNTKHIPHIPTVLYFFHVFFQGPTAPMAEGICWDPSGLNILETYWIIVTIKDHNFGPFQLVLLP